MLNNPTSDSKLQMVLFKKNNGSIEALDNGTPSSFEEDFSWFVGEDGKMIDYNKNINVFEAVQLLHHFLNKKYGISKETGRFRGRNKIN